MILAQTGNWNSAVSALGLTLRSWICGWCAVHSYTFGHFASELDTTKEAEDGYRTQWPGTASNGATNTGGAVKTWGGSIQTYRHKV